MTTNDAGDLLFLEGLFYLLHARQETDVVGEFVHRSGDAGEG